MSQRVTLISVNYGGNRCDKNSNKNKFILIGINATQNYIIFDDFNISS